MAGLDAAIRLGTQCPPKRDRRVKPGDDGVVDEEIHRTHDDG